MSITIIILISIIVLLAGYCIRLKLREAPTESAQKLQDTPKLHVSNNDIMHYIKEAAETFKPYIENRGADFRIKCEPESMMGWMDADVIDKILQLLIADIIRYMTENSKITLDVQTNKSYDHVIIRISDNGRKISSMTQTIVRHLVNIHHGMFRSEYLERQGNTVIIQLPIKKDAFAEDYTSSEQASPFHIPSNIELNIPTIEIPTGFEEGDRSLGEIIQEAYISADQEFVQRAIRCINEHMMDSDYDRETFAADMGSSVSTLYNKIRAVTGKNITNFVRDIRINAACKMARENPDLRVSDLAYQVGFKDPKYFATSFKRVMGIQPKEYIARQRSANH